MYVSAIQGIARIEDVDIEISDGCTEANRMQKINSN